MKTTRLLRFWLMIMTSVATAQMSIAETLVHETIIDAPVKDVWNAFTDADQITTWMVPKADIDLRLGGLLRTSYNPDAALDGPEAIHHRILAYEPQAMLAMQVVKCPDGFEFEQQIMDAWGVIYFKPLGPNRTAVRSVGCGYGSGGAWDRMRDFFDQGNAWTLEQLRVKFSNDDDADKPVDDATTVLKLLSRLVGGEWIHESTAPDGSIFRVRNVLHHGPDGRSIVGRGWLGNADGMFEHGSTQVFLDPLSKQTRFINIDERGAIAEGAITLVDANTVEWDWRIRGTEQTFNVLMRFTSDDAYAFTLRRPSDENPDELIQLVDITFERVDEAPQRFQTATRHQP